MNRFVLALVVVLVSVGVVGSAFFLMLGRATTKPAWTTDSPRALVAFEEALDATQKVYWADAVGFLERAVELDPSFAMARVSLAWMKSRGNTKELEALLKSIDTSGLTDRESMLIRYYLAHVENRHDDAGTLLNVYLAENPNDPYALNAACDEAWIRVAWERAEECYEQLIERHPNWVEAQRRLGYMAMGQGRFEEAEEHFQAYRYVAPDQANPHDSLGELRMLRGRYEEAEEAFRQALVNKPDFCPSHGHLARMAVFDEDHDAARAALETMATHEACREEASHLACYIEVLIHFSGSDFPAAWDAIQACPETMRNSVVAHRVALLAGHEEAAVSMEMALRKSFEAKTMVAPLEKQRYRSAALHFEGSRLLAEGKIEAGARRLAEADGLITYWGDGRWAFKLVNRLDWAGALELLGRDEEAGALRAEIDAVNPRFVAAFGTGSAALEAMAQAHQ